jgi:hypothetical protein
MVLHAAHTAPPSGARRYRRVTDLRPAIEMARNDSAREAERLRDAPALPVVIRNRQQAVHAKALGEAVVFLRARRQVVETVVQQFDIGAA